MLPSGTWSRPRPGHSVPPVPTLAERLAAARRRRFVGRSAERELFRQAVEGAGEPPFTVLHVHGPGGIGKSALLRVYGDLAVDAGRPVVLLDARDLPPERDAVRAAAELPDGGRAVLMIDTYEQLAALDGWVRDDLLPGLPADTVVVLAGRRPPAAAWTDDPGWADLVRVLPLAPLSPADADACLSAVPAAQRARVVTFCSGNPLALSLARDLAASGVDVPEGLVAPDVVGSLVSRLVDAAPTPEHRRAAGACAWARATDEALLRAVLGVADAAPLFDWLRAQPWVETGPLGVRPHDVVRDLLVADLRVRDAPAAAALHAAVRRDVVARMRTGADPGRAALDFLFALRHNPVTRAFVDWDRFGAVPAEPYRPGDRAAVEELLRRCGGEEGGAAAARWLDAQPAAFSVIRESGVDDAVRGVVCWLALHEAPADAVRADPVAARVREWAAARGVGRDSAVTVLRCFADRDADQGPSPAFDAAAVRHVRTVTGNSDLAVDVLVTTDPDRLAPVWTHIGYERTPELDVVLGGVRFAGFAHDWRDAGAHGVWGAVAPAAGAGPDRAFADAVRAALRDATRPDLLARNPLVGRVADDAAGLRTRIDDAVEALREHPRDARLHRALDRTYLRPAPTQERAAELLGLPFSTYRRHLGAGIDRVVATLWQEAGRFRSGG